MIKILVIYEQINNTIEVNLSVLKIILHQKDIKQRYKMSKDVSEMDLNWCDICYSMRPSSIYTLNIGKLIRDTGRIFITAFDDDLLNLPKHNSGSWCIKYTRECLSLSDLVIMCNPVLASAYQSLYPHINVAIIHALVNEQDIIPVGDENDVVKIVYAAGADHTAVFDSLIKPVLDKVFEKSDCKIELHLMGVCPNLSQLKYKENIKFHHPRPLEEYKKFMRNYCFDIGLAPLHDDSFSNKKYFRKYIDYAEFGIAGIYSNCAPYTFVVKDSYNGILVDNNPDSWYEAIVWAIDNLPSMKAMARNSQNHLRKDFSVSAIQSQFYSQIYPLLERLTSRSTIYYHRKHINEVIFEVRMIYHQIKSHILSDGFIGTSKIIMYRLIKRI